MLVSCTIVRSLRDFKKTSLQLLLGLSKILMVYKNSAIFQLSSAQLCPRRDRLSRWANGPASSTWCPPTCEGAPPIGYPGPTRSEWVGGLISIGFIQREQRRL